MFDGCLPRARASRPPPARSLVRRRLAVCRPVGPHALSLQTGSGCGWQSAKALPTTEKIGGWPIVANGPATLTELEGTACGLHEHHFLFCIVSYSPVAKKAGQPSQQCCSLKVFTYHPTGHLSKEVTVTHVHPSAYARGSMKYEGERSQWSRQMGIKSAGTV